MLYVKVNGETVVEAHNKTRAKTLANEVAREQFPSPECASITVEDKDGGVYRSIFYDGWNVYTHYSMER